MPYDDAPKDFGKCAPCAESASGLPVAQEEMQHFAGESVGVLPSRCEPTSSDARETPDHSSYRIGRWALQFHPSATGGGQWVTACLPTFENAIVRQGPDKEEESTGLFLATEWCPLLNYCIS